MKKIINWKSFFILLSCCAVSSALVVPYQVALSPELADVGMIVYVFSFLQGLVIFAPVTFFGLLLSEKVGFDLPVIEGEYKLVSLKAILIPSVLWGLLGGAAITVMVIPFGRVSLELMAAELAVPVWARFIALFYGGIAEEVLMRLFAMSLFAWLLIKLKLPKKVSIWAAMVIASVLFGLGHLPLTGQLTTITLSVVFRAILLNGIGGIVFGLLYWKKGLESAIISHFSAGIVLRFVTPLVARAILT